MNKITIKNLPDIPFDVDEALNQLRINLEFCGAEIKTIMITSSLPNEGKSFVSMHLWRSLAQLGRKVLLIDSDLRNSQMRSEYAMSSDTKITGIAYYLSGKTPLQDAIYMTNVENGYVIPLAETISNPAILLENERYSAMLDACAEVFDYVIVDTPPLASVADAMKIATHCDGSVLVVRGHATPRKLVINSAQQLKRTGKPLLGTVLNRVDVGKRKSSYYYGRYYRYGGYYNKYGYGKYGYGNYGKKKK